MSYFAKLLTAMLVVLSIIFFTVGHDTLPVSSAIERGSERTAAFEPLFKGSEDLTQASAGDMPVKTPSAAEPEANADKRQNEADLGVDLPPSAVQTLIRDMGEIAKYPPNSQPIINDQHLLSFKTNTAPSSELPFPFDDLEGDIQASIEMPKFHYSVDEVIGGRLKLDGLPAGANVSASAYLIDSLGKVLATAPMEGGLITSTAGEFSVEFTPGQLVIKGIKEEMLLAVQAQVADKELYMSLPFVISGGSAELSRVGYARVERVSLLIPVELEVSLAGYYFLAANLYSLSSNKPLIHLETEGRLDSGRAILTLDAHIQALKHGGEEGPYILRDFFLERWADEVYPDDVVASTRELENEVQGFPFSAYADEPYVDPLAEQRALLLQSLVAN